MNLFVAVGVTSLLRRVSMIRILPIFLLLLSSINSCEMKTVSESPRIYYFRDFLTDEECDYIINLASPELERSRVLASNKEGAIDDRRTSKGMFFPTHSQDPIVRSIEKKISKITEIPMKNGEGLQVLHYGVGDEFQPHHDYFDPSMPGGSESLARGGQRVATFILYLNTPEQGGETVFPEAKVKVFPKKGNAVLFYNVNPDGVEDPLSFHGGAPVIKGEKWIATKWMREKPFR